MRSAEEATYSKDQDITGDGLENQVLPILPRMDVLMSLPT